MRLAVFPLAYLNTGQTCQKGHFENMYIFYWTFLLLVKEIASIDSSLAGCLDNDPSWRYHTFSEKDFFFQCALPVTNPTKIFNDSSAYNNEVAWYRQQEDGTLLEMNFNGDTRIRQKGNSLWFSPVGIEDSGAYICNVRKEDLCLRITLKVWEKSNANCSNYGASEEYFIIDTGSSLSCPALGCYSDLQSSTVTWYKDGSKVVISETRFTLRLENNKIYWNTIYSFDSGIYACDYTQYTNTSQRLVRAVVTAKMIARDTKQKPRISNPINGTTQEVELGKPYQLKCKVTFGFQRNFSAVGRWYRNSPGPKGEQLKLDNERLLTSDLLEADYLYTTTLEKVTENDLKDTFICFAENPLGNSSVVLRLIKKSLDRVVLVYILCITIALLLLGFIGGALIYTYWIEIILLSRNYISKDETIGDKKDFDAFVSYANWNSLNPDDSLKETYNQEERFVVELLPEMLEDKYGYKLCILERDILPGGAYVEDITRIMKRSRRVIFILSPRCINDSSLFELQTAIKCTLEDETLKLIFIKFKPFKEPDSLPSVVKKALHVLPMVTWKEKFSKSPSSASKFWNKIRYHMPVKKTQVSKDKDTSVSKCPLSPY